MLNSIIFIQNDIDYYLLCGEIASYLIFLYILVNLSIFFTNNLILKIYACIRKKCASMKE